MTSLTARSARDRVSIREFLYCKSDVLDDKQQKVMRLSSLLKAVTYQSIADQPVTIYAQGVSSCIKVFDVVSSVDEDHVRLKSGVVIPIAAIIKIDTLM